MNVPQRLVDPEFLHLERMCACKSFDARDGCVPDLGAVVYEACTEGGEHARVGGDEVALCGAVGDVAHDFYGLIDERERNTKVN